MGWIMRVITENDADFKEYYLKCLDIEYFDTALLGENIPDIGSIIIIDNEILGLAISYKVSELDDITWWTVAWACKRKNSKQILKVSKDTIKRHPPQSRLVSYIMTRHKKDYLFYKASLFLSKVLGFKVINNNEICDIIEYRI